MVRLCLEVSFQRRHTFAERAEHGSIGALCLALIDEDRCPSSPCGREPVACSISSSRFQRPASSSRGFPALTLDALAPGAAPRRYRDSSKLTSLVFLPRWGFVRTPVGVMPATIYCQQRSDYSYRQSLERVSIAD
jgi:hypothetical protein